MIEFNNPTAALIIAKSAGCIYNPVVDQCIARLESLPNGVRLMGGVLYQNFLGASIGAHVAGYAPNWLNKDLLWVIFDYPFMQLSVRKIFLTIRENNGQAIVFASKLGFNEEARLKDVFPEDMLIFSMYREDCRWLKMKPRMRSNKHNVMPFQQFVEMPIAGVG